MRLFSEVSYRLGGLPVAAAGAALALGTTAFAGTFTEDLGQGWQVQYDTTVMGQPTYIDIVVDGYEDSDGDGDLDTIIIQKTAEFFSLSPVIIQFNQTAASTIEHIAIEDESIFNNSGFEWFDFHFQLVDGGDAMFNPALTAASGGQLPLGWFIEPFETFQYSADLTELDLFDTNGDGVDDQEAWFPGNGPGDGRLYIDVDSGAGTDQDPFTTFTLKETPTIPAPGVLALLGLAGLASSRRRRA